MEKFADFMQVENFSENDLEYAVGRLLAARKLTIACAESCTGGLLSGRLTAVPGSSAYVMGGVVSYTNEVKVSHLGVKQATLDAVGAVSQETAGEMAEGIRCRMHTDIGVLAVLRQTSLWGWCISPCPAVMVQWLHAMFFMAIASRCAGRQQKKLWRW